LIQQLTCEGRVGTPFMPAVWCQYTFDLWDNKSILCALILIQYELLGLSGKCDVNVVIALNFSIVSVNDSYMV